MWSLVRKIIEAILKGGGKAKPNKKPKTTKPGCKENCGKLPKTPKSPARRHDPCKTKGNDPTKERNSMLDPDVDVAGDIDAMKSGNFQKSGNDILVNGRTYEMHAETGTVYPKSGPGVHQMDRAQHQLLKQLNSQNLDKAMKFADNFPGLTPEKVDVVLKLWNKCP